MIQKNESECSAQSISANFRPENLTFKLPFTHVASVPQLCRPKPAVQEVVSAPIVRAGDEVQAPSSGETFKPNRQMRRAMPAIGIDIGGDGYLRLADVLSVYPVSRAGWYQGMLTGMYPQSVPLGKRAVGWTRESIRNLIANPPKF